MKKFIISALIIALSFLLKSCNTTEPPPPPNGEKPTLELTLEDASCIEAWIELKTTNLTLPATIILKQINPAGDTISHISILNTQDSLLYIDSLLPNQAYQYQVSSIENPANSNLLNVTTLDTTSHDFTFETFTFGGTAGSSTLYDCAIISPENIWCVGEIYVADTSQNGYTLYNAVHWDGSEWKLHRIMFYTICGQQHQNAYAASSIFAFSENDIWVAMLGSQIARLSDTTQIGTYCIPISVRKLWGTDSKNLYAVGVNGQIAYYNGSIWQRIESGTNLNIGDIWGIPDGNGGYNKYLAADNAMLKIDENNNLYRIDAEPGMDIISVWCIANRLIYTAGDGVVLYKNYHWEKIDRPDVNTIYRIRGQNYEDVCGIGGPGSIIYHFNGYSWQSINPVPNNRYWRIDINGNIIVASGYQGEKAAITILRRNN